MTGPHSSPISPHSWPQWSQPGISWMTKGARDKGQFVRVTAMEPADDQPDDESCTATVTLVSVP